MTCAKTLFASKLSLAAVNTALAAVVEMGTSSNVISSASSEPSKMSGLSGLSEPSGLSLSLSFIPRGGDGGGVSASPDVPFSSVGFGSTLPSISAGSMGQILVRFGVGSGSDVGGRGMSLAKIAYLRRGELIRGWCSSPGGFFGVAKGGRRTRGVLSVISARSHRISQRDA